eukprot:TRINITY_DN11927_c0_g1_i2.p1 TRINITY_DN11927_c0_g1~~TRINITY_DN11927_c0_g1_i2.p1  ORF type:complete len:890 (-),score=113.98 TRINITY_DN11927_c0_g1_i2:154-2823(-)
MGCGCVNPGSSGGSSGTRGFLTGYSDKDFVRSLSAEELKDKKRLLEFFRLLRESPVEGQFQDTERLRQLVRRRGVPQRFRWYVWRALSGWAGLYRPGLYEKALLKWPSARARDSIEKDLDRTFPGVEEFDEARKDHLRTLLRVYAALFPQIGYVQGMNFIAGFLLLVAGKAHDDAEVAAQDALFLFVQMMTKYHASLLFCENLPLLKLYTYQYRTLLERLFPDVHSHFFENNITPELYITKWLLTLYTGPLSVTTACRLWDLVVCEGLHFLVLVGLAIVKLLKPRLMKEQTEGLLELLSLRGGDYGPPPCGDAIVDAAMSLHLHTGKGAACTKVTPTLSQLRSEWEAEEPRDAAELERAYQQLMETLPEGYTLEAVVSGLSAAALSNSRGSNDSAFKACGSRLPPLTLPRQNSIFRGHGSGAGVRMQPSEDIPDVLRRGDVSGQGMPGAPSAAASLGKAIDPSKAYLIAAETRVELLTSMPSRSPGAVRTYDGQTLPALTGASRASSAVSAVSGFSGSSDASGSAFGKDAAAKKLPPIGSAGSGGSHGRSDGMAATKSGETSCTSHRLHQRSSSVGAFRAPTAWRKDEFRLFAPMAATYSQGIGAGSEHGGVYATTWTAGGRSKATVPPLRTLSLSTEILDAPSSARLPSAGNLEHTRSTSDLYSEVGGLVGSPPLSAARLISTAEAPHSSRNPRSATGALPTFPPAGPSMGRHSPRISSPDRSVPLGLTVDQRTLVDVLMMPLGAEAAGGPVSSGLPGRLHFKQPPPVVTAWCSPRPHWDVPTPSSAADEVTAAQCFSDERPLAATRALDVEALRASSPPFRERGPIGAVHAARASGGSYDFAPAVYRDLSIGPGGPCGGDAGLVSPLRRAGSVPQNDRSTSFSVKAR